MADPHLDRAPFRVVFVCTGNICRSPMAEVVFRDLAERAGLGGAVVSSSSGTGDWHVGERADVRTIEALARRGYDGSAHRAKQFTPTAFDANDLVIALDRTHERILRHWAQHDDHRDRIALLTSFDPTATGPDVADPYYGDARAFDDALGMIESASRALFQQLEPAIRPPRSGGLA
ncbi:low molecular weight protein-tyrosine-phosphatase [Microbacterium phosphatis]|uniref:low molecular weight protein-tyrosine-phosphatase n=1 Tax=Microbacterium phosphatis TaxID=3140248 RepID=UPI0031404A3C